MSLVQRFSNLSGRQTYVGGLLKHRRLGLPSPASLSDSVGLGWGLRICISIKFPGDSAAAGLGRAL